MSKASTQRTPVFHDRIATSLGANSNSDVVGPGRLSRCTNVTVIIDFADNCTAGAFVVQGSHHQDFPGTPKTIATINAPGSGGETEITLLSVGMYPFLRVRGSAGVNGDGADAIWMQGS